LQFFVAGLHLHEVALTEHDALLLVITFIGHDGIQHRIVAEHGQSPMHAAQANLVPGI